VEPQIGFVIEGERNIYIAGDTALTMVQLIPFANKA
jgi:hypothetical protein